MKSAKFSIVMLVILLASIFVPAGLAFADSPSVDDVKVFEDYTGVGVGDWMIVGVYNISGTNASTSLCDVYEYQWVIQLVDNVDGTVYTENAIKQCGMRPFGIYINASLAASPLAWNGDYSIRINASWGAVTASRTIVASDWIGSNLVGLDAWAINKAKAIGLFDTGLATTYIETVPVYGEVLNTIGGYLFDTGIPTLSDYRPDLFLLTKESVVIDYTPTNASSPYAVGLYTAPLADTLGVPIANALADAGAWFGISDRLMGAILTILGFLVVAVIASPSIAFIIILGGALIGVFALSIIYVIVFILAVVFVRGWFWSST